MSKPTVFIGSSSEGLNVAQALQSLLGGSAEVTVWDQGVFGFGASNLETLVDEAAKYDYGIVVFAPDDPVNVRGANLFAPRDNAVFELGLFMGSIGRKRTIVVASDSPNLRVPSDLAGITIAQYSSDRSDSNISAALGATVSQIKQHIHKMGSRDAMRCKLTKSEIRILKGDILDYAKPDNSVLFPTNVYFDTTSIGKIVEEKSTLGKWLARFQSEQEAENFNEALNHEIATSAMTPDGIQKDLPGKPGRKAPFLPGYTVHLNTNQGPVILTALTHVDDQGTNYRVSVNEEILFSALRHVWKRIEACPARGDLYMPLIGSGYGGMTHTTVLAHILLSYKSAEAAARIRLCNSLNVIVYHSDWGNGDWVRALFTGLLS